MMRDLDLEHPEITAACREGAPAPENGDCRAARWDYLEEHFRAFKAWLEAGDGDVLDRFIEENGWDYRSWLN